MNQATKWFPCLCDELYVSTRRNVSMTREHFESSGCRSTGLGKALNALVFATWHNEGKRSVNLGSRNDNVTSEE